VGLVKYTGYETRGALVKWRYADDIEWPPPKWVSGYSILKHKFAPYEHNGEGTGGERLSEGGEVKGGGGGGGGG
jgi:hypothetical protein